MDVKPRARPELAPLARLISEAPVAMLTTEEPDRSLRSRPMRTLQMDDDGALWFLTSISSSKITALDHHRRASLSYFGRDRRRFACVCGITQLIRDEAKASELWSAALLPWLRDGPDDPDVVLLKLTIEEARYWSEPAGPATVLVELAATRERQRIRSPE